MKASRFAGDPEVTGILGRLLGDRAPVPQSEQDRVKMAAIRAAVDGKAMIDGIVLERKEPEILEDRPAPPLEALPLHDDTEGKS